MECARLKVGQPVKQTMRKLSIIKQKAPTLSSSLSNSCPIKRMKRNLQIRNLVPVVATVATKSRNIRQNRPTIMKKMMPSHFNLPVVPSWPLPLS